ncbi:hypothetical protein PG988_015374 [Apiospora saccharicola]
MTNEDINTCKQIGDIKREMRSASAELSSTIIRENALVCAREMAKLKVRDVDELNAAGKRTRDDTVQTLQRKVRKLQHGDTAAVDDEDAFLEKPDIRLVQPPIGPFHVIIPGHVTDGFINIFDILLSKNSITRIPKCTHILEAYRGLPCIQKGMNRLVAILDKLQGPVAPIANRVQIFNSRHDYRSFL